MKDQLDLISVHSGESENELGREIESMFITEGYTPSFGKKSINELLDWGYDNFIFLLSDRDSIKENEHSIHEIEEIVNYSKDKKSRIQVFIVVKGNVTIKTPLESLPKFKLTEETELLELYTFFREVSANINLEIIQKRIEGKLEEFKVDKSRLYFRVSGGREKFDCELRLNNKVLERILKSNFQEFNFIQGFEAIWSSSLGIIECEIDSNTPSHFLVSLLSDFIKTDDNKDNDTPEEEVDIETKRAETISYPYLGETKIDIGKSSDALSILLTARSALPTMRNRLRSFISIRISNIDISKHDQALEYLLKVSNSILFQIDIILERAFFLKGQRENFNEIRKRNSRRTSTIEEGTKLGFPKFQYDKEPMSLYWYAKSNNEKPLFQFLSFYQVIEYYYPLYSSVVAKKKIQNFIKSPSFNVDRDKDVSSILSLIKIGAGGKSFGSEKEQLKSTLEGTIDSNDLRNYFSKDVERKSFYEKNKTKGFINQKITLNNPTSDLIEEVAQRIYEIRCKIVHSKSSSEDFDIILPFSSNVKKIQFDIDLTEFIARRILIANSKSID